MAVVVAPADDRSRQFSWRPTRFAASAAAPGSLPSRAPLGFGLAVYHALDRVAPAPYVESTLAAYSLSTGRAGEALRYALRLPASPARDELLARVAAAQGDASLALEYDLAAPDVGCRGVGG